MQRLVATLSGSGSRSAWWSRNLLTDKKATMENPWAGAQELFNKNARIDRNVARRLETLSRQEARDDKLAFAIEAGRVYGLRQQKYDMQLKRELNRAWRHAPTERCY